MNIKVSRKNFTLETFVIISLDLGGLHYQSQDSA